MAMISRVTVRKPAWQTVVMLTLLFWLSASLIVDTVVMPVLYTSGMMAESGFAIAGHSLFWVFNRVELVCAALVLTGILNLRYTLGNGTRPTHQAVFLASLLLVVALAFTYGLAPQMSGLGLQLNLFNPVSEPPALMNSLHAGYWLLETLKLLAGIVLLKECWNSLNLNLLGIGD
ncbi:hypothetical protein [Leptothermofonsia sp. ETS-13]|uniref:hypothetical protein n=1 Tax=Leptothermofonsia sp. ETS-13 TaxID=3035696 RepID=UPI003BA192BC